MKIPLSELDLPVRDLRATVDEDALDELAASLRDAGQLQPIGVRITDADRYEVVFGSRRTRAARLLGWTEINAELVDESPTLTAPAAKLIENVQRLDMTPIEEAYGLADLIGDGVADVRELQRQTGKSRSWVVSRLELLDMPEDLQGAVQAGVIGIGVARAFSTIKNQDVLTQYIKAAAENGCTTEAAYSWAAQAEFAASGIMTMDKIREAGDEAQQNRPVVDQQYSCFICSETQSWRRVNTLVVCGPCQDAIVTTRQQAA